MEYTFCELKKKTVINMKDGKKMGKITDVIFSYPKYEITGFVVSPSKLSFCCFDPITIRPCDIETIGEDAILVCIRTNCNCSFTQQDICDYEE